MYMPPRIHTQIYSPPHRPILSQKLIALCSHLCCSWNHRLYSSPQAGAIYFLKPPLALYPHQLQGFYPTAWLVFVKAFIGCHGEGGQFLLSRALLAFMPRSHTHTHTLILLQVLTCSPRQVTQQWWQHTQRSSQVFFNNAFSVYLHKKLEQIKV